MNNYNYFFNLIDRLFSIPQRRQIMHLYLYCLEIEEECINKPKEWLLGLIGSVTSLKKRRIIMSLCLHKINLSEKLKCFPKTLCIILITLPIILFINNPYDKHHNLYNKLFTKQTETKQYKTEKKSYWKNTQLLSGESINEALIRLGVNKNDSTLFVKSTSLHNKLNPEGNVAANITTDGDLRAIHFLNNNKNGTHVFIAMQKINAKWHKDINPLKEQSIPSNHIINIKTSVSDNLALAGIPLEVCAQLDDIFSEKFKLNKLSTGDTIHLTYQINLYNGNAISSGNILSAIITHKKKKYSAFLFKYDGSNSAYYDDKGNPLKHGFQQEPIAGAQISSYFGIKINTIHHSIKIHDGINYIANEGTPIVTPANGIITELQKDNGYGNMVKIDHGNSIETIYAYLSGFKHNLHINQKVKAGELIGYVGSTGLTKTANLHFEVRKNGFAIDPTTSVLPTHKLNKEELSAFQTKKAILLAESNNK